MTTPAELRALADRCEAVAGPDRELDAAIAIAAKQVPYDFEPAFLPGEWRAIYDNRHWSAPAYTASVDAAMSLVPEGAGFNLDRYWIREGVRWRATISTGGVPENPRQVFEVWDAHSAPLAIVAAALRERAASATISEQNP